MDASTSTKQTRDDFPATQKQWLAKRVNYHCSNCDAPTSAADSASQKAFSVGIAAHIKAASPGGPRYDASQSSEERRSIENGIWLCSNCSILVDADAEAYPVSRLLKMKRNAESLARGRVGRPPVPTPPMLSSAAEIQRAIDFYCMSEAMRAEALDPRFSASVSYSNGTTSYEFQPRQAVEGQIIVGAADTARFAKGLQEFQDYGGTVQFEDIVASFEGSPLFHTPTDKLRRLELSSGSRTALVTLKLSTSGATSYLEFHGKLTNGTKGARFQGTALGGLASITLSSDVGTNQSQMKLNVDVKAWRGKPVLKLPYFDRLHACIEAIAHQAAADITVEIEGQTAFSGGGVVPSGPLILAHLKFLRHVAILRRLDTFFGANLTLPRDLKEVFKDSKSIEDLLLLVCINDAEDPEIRFGLTFSDSRELAEWMRKVDEQQSTDLLFTQEVDLHILGGDYGSYVVEIGCAHTNINVVGPAVTTLNVPIPMACRPVEGHQWFARARVDCT